MSGTDRQSPDAKPEHGEHVRIVADIGGTNARFACIRPGRGTLADLRAYPCADFGRLQDAVKAYLASLDEKNALKVGSICMAVAASVHHDVIRLTNRAWTFSQSALSQELNTTVTVLNDFSAQAWFLTTLQERDLQWLQRPEHFSQERSQMDYRTIVGPGTGFGAATLSPAREVVASEPGHCSFAPVNRHEADLLETLWQRFDRVSVEHVFSGPGLANLYWANARLAGADMWLEAPDVVARARDASPDSDDAALQAVRDFSAIAGSVCGDIALTMGSLGGLYLSGDIFAKMGDLFDQTLFLERFAQKGPFSQWCAGIPVARVTTRNVGLLGCAAYVNEHAYRNGQYGEAAR